MYVCGFFPKETIPSGVELVEVIALNTTTAHHHGTFYCYLVKKKGNYSKGCKTNACVT